MIGRNGPGVLTGDLAREKRDQLITDGYCVIDDILQEGFLDELRRESDRMIDAVEDPPPHWKYQGSDIHVSGKDEPVMDRLLHWPPTRRALQTMGLDDFTHGGMVIILSKPPGGAALYWHQDWTRWNDPISLAPWPQYLFLAYYLVDTNLENGCLRVLPGTHRRRIDLHDRLLTAHQDGVDTVVEDDPDMFCDHPEAVDVPVKAGSLVIGEGRALHAARPNRGSQRRTLLLAWHSRPLTVPAYWTGSVPELIRHRDPDAAYPGTRVPGEYLV